MKVPCVLNFVWAASSQAQLPVIQSSQQCGPLFIPGAMRTWWNPCKTFATCFSVGYMLVLLNNNTRPVFSFSKHDTVDERPQDLFCWDVLREVGSRGWSFHVCPNVCAGHNPSIIVCILKSFAFMTAKDLLRTGHKRGCMFPHGGPPQNGWMMSCSFVFIFMTTIVSLCYIPPGAIFLRQVV